MLVNAGGGRESVCAGRRAGDVTYRWVYGRRQAPAVVYIYSK